ncbi:MAG: winged helix-turn-helix transcriptional regulator [Firmicutes bacterium]|nr:winged helix-turn-helix transcriptional regulator [Bacillota bacterium]
MAGTEGTRSTRAEILGLLQQHPGATVAELSTQLGITAMAVRQHLAILERDGLVRVGRRRGGAGRPAHVYFLTEAGQETFGQAYDAFALEFLRAAERVGGRELVDRLFAERAGEMGALLARRLGEEQGAGRLRKLIEAEREGGYRGELRSEGEKFDFLQYNCPIARVAARYPEACAHDHALYERLLGVRLERTGCAAVDDGPCVYSGRWGSGRQGAS